MPRRESPYSQTDTVRRIRGELGGLILVTVILGLLLDVAAAALYEWLGGPAAPRSAFLVGAGVATILLLVTAMLFYGRSRTRVPIDIYVPYHLPSPQHVEVVQRRSYQLTEHVQRAFRRRYPDGSAEEAELCAAWTKAQLEGRAFQQFIEPSHVQLLQWLLLFALHRHGLRTVGFHSHFRWRRSALPKHEFALGDLPEPLRTNPVILAEIKDPEWRLPLPQDVSLRVLPHRDDLCHWQLTLGCFGQVDLILHSGLIVAASTSQAHRTLTLRLSPTKRSQIYVIGTRLEAIADLRWPFLPGADAFHEWAADLLSYLEEALDWGYYLAARADRVAGELEWKIGWVPEDTSLADMLQDIQARLERLEANVSAHKEPGSQQKPGS